MPATASIIIRCYNEEKHIGRLLEGITQQTYRDWEIILVDSGSTDRTLEIAAQYPVTLVSIRAEDFTYGRALNLGCQAATGEFLVMVSAHTYPCDRTWLDHLLRPFQQPRVALTYGKQRGNSDTQYAEHQIFAHWFPNHSIPGQSHPFCNNANAAIRRSLWEVLPYDEQLPGLEDLDWATRAMQMGYDVAYAAEAGIVHVHEEKARQIYRRYRREAIALKHQFPQQALTLRQSLHLALSNILSDCRYAYQEEQLGEQILPILRFRVLQFLGSYHGFYQASQMSPIGESVAPSSAWVNAHLRHIFYYPRTAPALPRWRHRGLLHSQKTECVLAMQSTGR